MNREELELVGQTFKHGAAEFTYEIRDGEMKFRVKGETTVDGWVRLGMEMTGASSPILDSSSPMPDINAAECRIGWIHLRQYNGLMRVSGSSQWPFKAGQDACYRAARQVYAAGVILQHASMAGMRRINKASISEAISGAVFDLFG